MRRQGARKIAHAVLAGEIKKRRGFAIMFANQVDEIVLVAVRRDYVLATRGTRGFGGTRANHESRQRQKLRPPRVLGANRHESAVFGPRPVAGRGNASELKYPPDTRYDQTELGAAENDAFAPNRPPAPLPTPDPAEWA